MCRIIRYGNKWDLREKMEGKFNFERVGRESIGQVEQERCLEGSVYSWFSIRKLCFYWQGGVDRKSGSRKKVTAKTKECQCERM